MTDYDLRVPDDAPPAPDGCEWLHSTLIREGDLLYMGERDLFGERERFFHRVISIDEKPRTFAVVLAPTHPRLFGRERRRWRKDEWLIVRRPA